MSLGLKAAGYEYLNIDVRASAYYLVNSECFILFQDCWSLMARDSSTGTIVPDPVKFPNGISGVATQVHALGLKIGIYR